MARKYLKTRNEYAVAYGVSLRTIDRYKAADYPLDDPAEMASIFAAQKSSVEDSDPKDNSPDSIAVQIRAARLEKIVLECRRLAFMADRDAGHYVSVDDLRPQLLTMVSEIKCAFVELENSLPPLCEGLSAGEMQSVVRAKIDSILLNLSKGADKLSTSPC